MAGFGGEYAGFARFVGEETGASAPVYGEAVSLGPFVSGNLTITNASGELYGDNALQEKVDKFASGAIPMEVTECPKKSIAEIYGATYDEANKSVGYSADDEAPYGALWYIRNILRKGKEIFEPNFYAKAQASRTTDNTQTRSGSITFTNHTINWTLMAPMHKETKWQDTAEFDTREEAIAWINEKLGVSESGILAPLTVVSVAGITPGETEIYVNPLLEDGNSYMYTTASLVELPELNEVIVDGWTAWDGLDEIEAVTGNQIAIVEVDSEGKAVKGGIATVTAAE
jgi:hypothetical protein